ncbi:Charged multivesicular body protein 5 [Wickerhamiella sorbophila]|uniref:Charged multivesicular body protein 5 n=1 Tax=Wickerhamiella sorbophila TaxID=45607 RepID=A0A2T0FCT2_9ASCO|nr:Charged multivesicular body protein 5 [Wickerhamiella sorbophila]PRT52775.1 Charged multivesicular body protein 5 [Wickerhamiella sorbophila]
MNRIFGTKSAAPKPTLNEAIGGLEERISSLDVRLAKLNGELTSYQQKMANMRDGPGKNAIKQRALKVLKQRKQIEVQRDQLQAQSWNMEQASMTSENLRNTMATLDAMKTANKELKKQYGKVNVDKIEELQDEMADLMDMADELQDTMSRNYSVADEVDEAELDAELEALGEELEFEQAEPSYLQEEMPTFVDEQQEPAVANAAQ